MIDARDVWAAVGASRPGTSHLKRNLPCQDACVASVLPNGTLVVAVADGAGSASHGGEGAHIATRAVSDYLLEALARYPDAPMPLLLTESFEYARSKIQNEASRTERAEIGSFATTLLVAVAARDWFAAAQRGDGAIVVRAESGLLYTAAPPQTGGYANQTYFLTDRVGGTMFDYEILPPARSFALLTDGLTPLAIIDKDNGPHPAFFEPFEQFALNARDPAVASEQLGEFLMSERVCSRTDDDKTLFVAVRRPI
jgi:hypothetical protein